MTSPTPKPVARVHSCTSCALSWISYALLRGVSSDLSLNTGVLVWGSRPTGSLHARVILELFMTLVLCSQKFSRKGCEYSSHLFPENNPCSCRISFDRGLLYLQRHGAACMVPTDKGFIYDEQWLLSTSHPSTNTLLLLHYY